MKPKPSHRSLWPQPKFGWGMKQARGQSFFFWSTSTSTDWKNQFFVLDKKQKAIRYYANSIFDDHGEGVPDGNICLSLARVRMLRNEVDGKSHVVKITPSGKKPVNIAFGTDEDAKTWVKEVIGCNF
jgi:hypothetical protein